VVRQDERDPLVRLGRERDKEFREIGQEIEVLEVEEAQALQIEGGFPQTSEQVQDGQGPLPLEGIIPQIIEKDPAGILQVPQPPPGIGKICVQKETQLRESLKTAGIEEGFDPQNRRKIREHEGSESQGKSAGRSQKTHRFHQNLEAPDRAQKTVLKTQ
jgi:hypothetical protein